MTSGRAEQQPKSPKPLRTAGRDPNQNNKMCASAVLPFLHDFSCRQLISGISRVSACVDSGWVRGPSGPLVLRSASSNGKKCRPNRNSFGTNGRSMSSTEFQLASADSSFHLIKFESCNWYQNILEFHKFSNSPLKVWKGVQVVSVWENQFFARNFQFFPGFQRGL